MKTIALGKWTRQLPLASLGVLAALTLGGGGKDPDAGAALLERVGSWPGYTRGPALSIAVANHHAFVAIGEGGLAVLDVTDPAKPVRVGGFRPPGRTEQVWVRGQRAYLATSVHAGGGCEMEAWRGRLVILDVSDPPRPRFLGSYMTGSSIDSVCGDGVLMFLTITEAPIYGPCFYAVDVSDPARVVTVHVGEGARPVLWAGGEHLYAAGGAQHWTVIGVRDPASPVYLTDVPVNATAIRVVGQRAYVIDGEGLQVYEITAPERPQLLGRVAVAGAGDLQLVGNYAFITAPQSGVTAVDVTNPGQPAIVGTWRALGLKHIEAAGDHAFVLDEEGKLGVLDLTSPTNLLEVAGFDTGLTAREVHIAGTKACLLSSDSNRSRLEIIDISNPTQPALMETHEGAWEALTNLLPVLGFESAGPGQRIADGYSFSSLGWEGFAVSNVLSLTNTVRVGGYDTLGEVHDLWITNRYAYVAEGWEGLEVFDISELARPFPIGGVSTHGQARGVCVAGNYAYAAEGGTGLGIFSLAPGPATIIEDPPSLGVAAGSGATLTVRAYGRGPLTYQWYTGESGDVSRPIPGATSATYSTPALAEACSYWVRVSSADGVSDSRTAWAHLVPPVSVELLGLAGGSTDQPATNLEGIAVLGEFAYATAYDPQTGEGRLDILDVSDPARPTLRRVLALQPRLFPSLVAVSSNRLYTTYQCFSLTDPVQPLPVTDWPSTPTRFFGSLAAVGDYLYSPGDGLDIVDVRNPATPIGVDHYSCMDLGPWRGGLCLDQHYAFWARGWAGMEILDLSVPTAPRHVGAYFPEAAAVNVAVQGDLALLAEAPYEWCCGDGFTGIEVLDVSDLKHPVRLAKVALPTVSNVALMRNYACVTGDGLLVFDLSDPRHPVCVGRHQPGWATGCLQVVGDLAYVAAGERGLAIYRVVPQLKLNPPVREGTGLRLSWLPASGIRLQRTKSISPPTWEDVPNTEGVSSLWMSTTNAAGFFRLARP